MTKRKNKNADLVYLFMVLGIIAVGGVGIGLLIHQQSQNPRMPEKDKSNLKDNDSADIEKFKISMHAFISMVSMEKLGCEILTAKDPGCYTCLTKDSDPGWKPEIFHHFFQKILSNINTFDLSEKTKELIAIWEQHSVQCGEFFSNKNPERNHFLLIKKLLNSNNVVIYPWRTNNHTVYIEIVQDTYSYRIRIFDFGVGRQFEQTLYQPIEFGNLTEEEFRKTISSFAVRYGSYLSDAELSDLYKQEDFLCTSCIPEYKQETGNCVVKNLLAAIQQDAIDRYGEREGINIFSEFYVAVLAAILDEARLYVSHYFISELPDFNLLCDQIKKTQIAFSGTSDRRLQQIKTKYEIMRQLCTTRNHDLSVPSVCTAQTTLLSYPAYFVTERGTIERDTGLRRGGKDIEDIREFLHKLGRALERNEILDPNEIPASLRRRYVDGHQVQHLSGRGYPQKSKFSELIATSPENPTLHALANVVNKLVSEYCKRNRISGREARLDNFMVDVGFNIGTLRGSRGGTSCIKIDGFTGGNYHIFPVSPNENAIRIDVSEILKANALHRNSGPSSVYRR